MKINTLEFCKKDRNKDRNLNLKIESLNLKI